VKLERLIPLVVPLKGDGEQTCIICGHLLRQSRLIHIIDGGAAVAHPDYRGIPSPAMTCCVCGGPHHPDDCARAQEYVRQCLEARTSPPPPRPVPWWNPDTGIFEVEITTATRWDSWRFGRRVQQHG
jgi:hypothetical protein